jgi:hypothetical protein
LPQFFVQVRDDFPQFEADVLSRFRLGDLLDPRGDPAPHVLASEIAGRLDDQLDAVLQRLPSLLVLVDALGFGGLGLALAAGRACCAACWRKMAGTETALDSSTASASACCTTSSGTSASCCALAESFLLMPASRRVGGASKLGSRLVPSFVGLPPCVPPVANPPLVSFCSLIT